MAVSHSPVRHIRMNPQVRSPYVKHTRSSMSCFCICQLLLAAQKQSAKSNILHLYNQCGSLSSYSKADIHLYKTQGGTQKTYLPLAAQWATIATGWTQLRSKMSFPLFFLSVWNGFKKYCFHIDWTVSEIICWDVAAWLANSIAIHGAAH